MYARSCDATSAAGSEPAGATPSFVIQQGVCRAAGSIARCARWHSEHRPPGLPVLHLPSLSGGKRSSWRILCAVRTLGIDLASQPKNTAVCEIDWSSGRVEIEDRTLDDDALVARILAVDKAGIDA